MYLILAEVYAEKRADLLPVVGDVIRRKFPDAKVIDKEFIKSRKWEAVSFLIFVPSMEEDCNKEQDRLFKALRRLKGVIKVDTTLWNLMQGGRIVRWSKRDGKQKINF